MNRTRKLIALLAWFCMLPFLAAGQGNSSATFTWTGAGVGNSWDNAANWNKNGQPSNDFPKNNDIAVIDPATQAFPDTDQPVIDDSGKTKIKQLIIGGGTTVLTVDPGSDGLEVSESLNISGGTIDMNDNPLTVKSGMSGILIQSGGAINMGTGVLTVHTLTQTGGTINIGASTGNVITSGNFSGNLNITGGTVAVSNGAGKAGGTMTLAAGATFDVQGDFMVSNGMITITSGTLKTLNVFSQSGGTVDLGGSTFSPGDAISLNGGTLKNGTVNCEDFSEIASTTLQDLTLNKMASATSGNTSSGNNLWSGACVVANQSAFTWTFQNLSDDNINGSASFDGTGGDIQVANAANIIISNDGSLSVSSGVTFGAGTLLFFGSGAKSFTYLGMSTLSIPNLEIDEDPGGNAGTATLSGDMIITDKLSTRAGIITPPAGGLTLAPGVNTNISNDEGYVSGPINFQVDADMVSLPFPIGKGGVFRPATVSINFNAVTVATVTAELINSSAAALGYTIPEDSDIKNVSDIRYWKIDCSGCSGNVLSAAVNLEYRDEKVEGISDPGTLVVAKSAATPEGTIWENLGGPGANGTIQSGSFTEFSIFALGNTGDNILPVELTRFEAALQGTDIDISWETASETNNDHFLVEHSLDGVDFVSLTKVKGGGDSQTPLFYHWRHEDAPAGLNYYRLKQVDFDGAYEYSEIISVRIATGAVYLYPNPAKDEIRVVAQSREDLEYEIFDTFGRLIKRARAVPEDRINVADLPAGNYLIRLKTISGTVLMSEKIVKGE